MRKQWTKLVVNKKGPAPGDTVEKAKGKEQSEGITNDKPSQSVPGGKGPKNRVWLLSKFEENVHDSREMLEEAGFRILREHDDWYYEVEPPEGWKFKTVGVIHGEQVMEILDERERYMGKQVIGKNHVGEYTFVSIREKDYYNKYR